MLEALSAANFGETLAYLARSPYDNVYVSWLIATGQAERSGEVTVSREAGAIDGVCYFGPQIVPYADSESALAAFAMRAARARGTRMIVGPRHAVERLWQGAKAALPPPVAVRASQPLYALTRATLCGSRADANVGQAGLGELDEIVPHSARMTAGEVGGDPRRASVEFRARTARIIRAGWWWVSRVDGTLAFTCNVGSTSPQTAQLQGVWTPPELRGRGHATRALAAICDCLLDEHATLCLYVNDFNTSAIALYERVGFKRAGEFSTLLFA